MNEGERIDRDGVPGLLTRPPNGTREFLPACSHPFIDPVKQLETLAELLAQGFLSRDEFEYYKHHVVCGR